MRVFDGEQVVQRADVIVRGGRVIASGPQAPIDSAWPVMEGEGMTLLKNGFAVDRARAGGTRVPDLRGQALSDFEADTSSRYGNGWSASSDRMMGGKSRARVKTASPAAP